MKSGISEKRRSSRCKVNVSIIIQSHQDTRSFVTARVTNISLFGVCFQSGKQYKQGERLSLRVVESGELPIVHISGETIWSESSKNASGKTVYNTGVKLLLFKDTDSERYALALCVRSQSYLMQLTGHTLVEDIVLSKK